MIEFLLSILSSIDLGTLCQFLNAVNAAFNIGKAIFGKKDKTK